MASGTNANVAEGARHLQKKDIVVNVFESARQLLSAETSLMKRHEIFFSDYSILPLFVQENYTNVRAPRIGSVI